MVHLTCQKYWLLQILFSAALVNIIILIYLTSKSCDVPISALCSSEWKAVNCGKIDTLYKTFDYSSFTFILREFEDFSNDVVNTTLNLSKTFKKSKVLIISDMVPYPPLMLANSANIHLVPLRGAVDRQMSSSRPDTYIHSKYVIIIPDGVQINSQFSLEEAVKFLVTWQRMNPMITMVAWPMNLAAANCLTLDIDLKKWTVSHYVLKNDTVCDAVEGGRFVLLLSAKTLLDLPYPYLRPYQPAIFIQNRLQGHKVIVDKRNGLFYQNVNIFTSDPHKNWKHKRKEQTRLQEAFYLLGIKRIVYESGRDEWYGCGKETARCFGTVVNDMPEFIYQNRWTPPCCLKALRSTVWHVFKILTDQGVRFWLEGGSLLGAVRNGDIIPWDYDVDIGIYHDDIVKSTHIVSCQSQVLEDDDGFVWEPASEGEFFRVQYSQTNHLHVDIFPFYSLNGTMTKNTWFKTHRQDREFPEAFLQPLERIPFVGLQAPVPNNARKFLEFKFGQGVVENPRYPNAQSV